MRILALIIAALATVGQCVANSFDQVDRRDVVAVVTTCTTGLRKPTPTALICGLGGTLSSPDPIEPPFQAVATAGVSASNACRNACIKKSSCLSFSFFKSNLTCSLFGKAIQSQGFKSSSSEHNTLYYDKRCFYSSCQTVSPTSSTVTITVTSTTTITAAPTDDVFRFSFGYDLLSIAGGTVTVNSTFQQTSIAVDGTWIWNQQFGLNGGETVYSTDIYSITPNTEYTATVYCYSYTSSDSCTLTMYAYNQADGILAAGSAQPCGFEEFEDIFVSFNTGNGTGVSMKYVFRCSAGQGPNGIGPEIAIDAVSLRPT